ncbi:hypothetical protein PRZ48_005471 [Zasmidium cellare]|uniref:Uncharacterized protein n=1 Tax=Zasmidium cellare TaxID=395010 RepID=A0ABR0ETW6_ZASCE|nr:hypothetical protein PRZ48_005471 [Zasmidium cellare]
MSSYFDPSSKSSPTSSDISPGVSDTTASSPAVRQHSQQTTPGIGPHGHAAGLIPGGTYAGNATGQSPSFSPAERNASSTGMQRPPPISTYSNAQLSAQSPTPGYRPMTGPNGSRPKDNLCRPM